jgi:uncharacterized protein YabN with tetrapyrrole methylase and pyrophosphatase domain
MLKMMGGGGSNAAARQDAIVSLQKASKTWKSFDWASKSTQWESTTTENKETRESSQAARKQLAETTKLLKRAVKTVETSGKALGSNQSDETVAATVKAIETLSKQARVTVKSYQGE